MSKIDFVVIVVVAAETAVPVRPPHRGQLFTGPRGTLECVCVCGGGVVGGHARLLDYARHHPGRLADRSLKKMERLVSCRGETDRGPDQLPVAAEQYLLRVMRPRFPAMGIRNDRELSTVARALDHLAAGEVSRAADVLAQRFKALSKSVADGGTWANAQYIELLEAETPTLLDEDEERLITAQVALRRRIDGTQQEGRNPWVARYPSQKGQGKRARRPGKKGGKGKES